jgi:hypothetical protein
MEMVQESSEQAGEPGNRVRSQRGGRRRQGGLCILGILAGGRSME